MIPHSYDASAEERLAWLADRAAQTFADDPAAARRWLEQPRRDLAGFTPAQCALLGGAPMQRVTTLLARATVATPAAVVPAMRADATAAVTRASATASAA